jgi:hypothetical protein
VNSVAATIIAIISGLGAIVTAVGGVLLAIRTVRSRERTAAKHELDQVIAEMSYIESLLDWERVGRVDAEAYNHDLLVLLRAAGITEPPLPTVRAPRPLRPLPSPLPEPEPSESVEESDAERDDQPGGQDLADPGDSLRPGGDPGGSVHHLGRRRRSHG